MPGIYLYTGNRLELLADKFADLLHADPLPPFTRETVLIQSRGMARWLALETAGRINIWANCDCPFPNSFIRNIYKLILPETAEQSSYDKKFLEWHLMDIIPSLLSAPHFDKVRNYLDSDDGLKLYQLAHELSDLFDQYTIFRPEMVLDWETNGTILSDDHKWQADLWQHLVNRLGKDGREYHRAKLLHRFEEKISSPQFDTSLLPSRISIFGISSLPPYHLRVLASLARHADLHIFIMNPCMEFWADIIADRDIVKVGRATETSRELLHLEYGNTLLSSMGHLGRDFLALIQELDCKEEEFFHNPGADTLLESIQQDILLLRENPAAASSGPSAGKKINPDDDSIVFQSCHSPMREVEILHNQLLELFDKHSGSKRLTPRDILVMAPDINEYAPLIRAVFDAGNLQEQKLPYSIADQAITGSSRYLEAFRTILSLAASRFTSIDVISLLKFEPVRRKFTIAEHEIPVLERWIDHTGICWGIDQNHKKALNLPGFIENTWRAGLDRLLLGYAMCGGDRIIFEKILPYDHMEGSVAELLGRFLDFAEPLLGLQKTLRRKHTLSEWAEILLQIRDSFLLPDDTLESDSRLLCHTLYELDELQPRTSYQSTVSIDVIEEYLFDTLEQRYSSLIGGTDFLTGSITFCSMLPMRSIPSKVICLLGMNDGAYPRPGSRRSFDLMAHDPVRGDRSRRHDDRYLFLETILSTRKKLSISFTGQSVRDTGPKPPSVLVSELMDYIEQGYVLTGSEKGSGSIVEHLTTSHRLQPFHPHYFRPHEGNRPNDLFSYSMENCEAAAVLNSEPKKLAPAIQSPLPTIQNSHNGLELHELISFFTQPVRYFLLKRIGIAPIEEVREHNTVEPFILKGLARYTLENDILAQLVSGNDCRDLYLTKKAAGVLPHGETGEIFFARKLAAVQSFKNKLDRLFFPDGRLHREFTLLLRDHTISGRLENLTGTGLVLYRYTTIKPKDIIRGWIYHLVFNSVDLDQETASEKNTYLAGTDRIYWYKPVSDSRENLEQLLKLFQRGLTEPLHFFPETSFAYAQGVFQGKDRQENITRAKNKWEGNAFAGRAEKNDPYNMLCLKDMNPAETDFADLAEEFFLPVFKYMVSYSGN